MEEVKVKERCVENLSIIKEKNVEKYKIGIRDYITSAFPRIPSNANINKGRCGNGGTTLEIKDNRNSLIVVPNISIIKAKKRVSNHLFEVYGNTTVEEISNYLHECLFYGIYIKMMSTPDSCWKIIQASKVIDYDIFKDCFFLFDEAHCVATEGLYRNISGVFDIFFQFENKSLISATPYLYSDPRIEALKKIQIEFNEPFEEKVKIIVSNSIINTLKKLIEGNPSKNLHIFYNTVSGAVELIDFLGLKDVSVFCAYSDENMRKLGIHTNLFKDLNGADLSYSKVNIYTSKYNEGWDLHDDNAVIIMVSDIYKPQTCFGIIKGVQIIGRLRGPNEKNIYHVTNTRERNVNPLAMEEIKNKIKYEADDIINTYNVFNSYPMAQNTRDLFMPKMSIEVNRYGDIEAVCGSAALNHSKLDAMINSHISYEQYLNTDTLKKAWSETGFGYEVGFDEEALSTAERKRLSNSRIGSSKKNKIIFDKIHELVNSDTSNGKRIVFNSPLEDIKKSHPQLFAYYEVLEFEKIVELNYNSKALENEYTIKTASNIEVSLALAKLVQSHFKEYTFYSRNYIKEHLQEIYKSVNCNIHVTAKKIEKFFFADEINKNIDGNTVRGFQLGMRLIKF